MKPYYQTDNGVLYHGDCLEIMPQLESVDLVLTDPPYGINGSSGTINKKRAKGNYDKLKDDREYVRSVVVPAIRFAISISTGLIVTPGSPNFDLYPKTTSFGCFYQPASVGIQSFGNADAQPIFYYGKNPTRRNVGKKCSFQVTARPPKTDHPCPKPHMPWFSIVSAHSLGGQTVLDPFIGSGTTAIACERLGRKWIGIEISEKYCEIAAQRIENEYRQRKLF